MGDTATIITNALSNKVTKSGQDPEDLIRWSFTTMEGKNQNKITVINAYKHYKGTNNEGISKVSSQQCDLLEEQGRESENAHNTMIKD